MTLASWTCDTCGKAVTAEDGYVVWRNEEKKTADFLIVHQTTCDPEGEYHLSMPLDTFLGADGLSYLLAFLDSGPIDGDGYSKVGDFAAFVDFARRVQIPHYEEARGRFHDEDVQDQFAGANQYRPYLQDALQSMASGAEPARLR